MALFGRQGGGETLPRGHNMRDLGGWSLATIPGRKTRDFRLVRSGLLNGMPHAELREALRYGPGIAHVLDLRGPAEVEAAPDVLASQRHVDYRNICLLDADLAASGSVASQMAHGYIHMLANASAVREIFEWLAACGERGDGVVLYHCTGGMDRTGVLTMLILGLSGVGRDDICRDYLRSFGSWDDAEEALWAPAGTYGYDEMTSRRDMFLSVYDDVISRFGTIGEYLGACSISKEALIEVARWLCA